MKKLFLFVLALSLICGSAYAAGIPTGVDPSAYPEVWTQEVFNNGPATLISGTVVVWDCGRASGTYTDRKMYVSVTSVPDDIRVAGVVVDDSIAVSNVGTIAIYGPVYARCADSTDAITINHAVACAGPTPTPAVGMAGQADTAAVNNGVLGWAISASPNTEANGGYLCADGVDGTMLPIFVNPSAL